MNHFGRITGLILLLSTHALCAAEGTLAQKQARRLGPAPFEVIPQVSLVMPTKFVLTTGDYAIPYSDSLTGFPLFTLAAAFPLTWFAGLELQGFLSAGYASKTALITVREVSTGTDFRDEVHLRWVPVSAGLMTSFEVSKFRFMKPTIMAGGGAQWLRQTANMSSVDGSYLSPFVYFAPGLTFSQGERVSWFGGFTFSTTFRFSLGHQQVNAWSYDLGLNFWL